MVKHSPTGYKNILKFLILIRPYWKNIVVFIISGLILTLLSLPYPWLTKVMIDDVMLKQDASLLYVILIGTFLLTAIRSALSSLRTYYISYVQHAMAFDIQFDFFTHLQRLSFSFYDSHEVPEILSRLRDAAQSRRILIDVVNKIVTNLLYLSIVPVIVLISPNVCGSINFTAGHSTGGHLGFPHSVLQVSFKQMCSYCRANER